MITVITAGGPAAELPDFSRWPEARFIGVDAGCISLLDRGITPFAAVGDFDSVTEAEYARLRGLFPDLEKVPAEKDETDTELALAKAVSLGAAEIVVTGVTGGRLDHFMSALQAVFAYQERYPDLFLHIVNRQNRLRFLKPGAHEVSADPAFPYVSFYPFASEVTGFSLHRFKYTVSGETIPFGSTRFISNELEETGIVEFASGSCLMIESRDL